MYEKLSPRPYSVSSSAVSAVSPSRLALMASGIWLVLVMPPVRAELESAMWLHMLVQLPLLVGIGWFWGAWLRQCPIRTNVGRWVNQLQRANLGGVTGVIVAAFAMTLWMLPRALDTARLEVTWDVVKFVTLPISVGVAAALSWYRCHPIARGVLHLEIIATFWRFGWAYLATDQRLCLAYLLDDQKITGVALTVFGVVWAVCAGWKPLFGYK